MNGHTGHAAAAGAPSALAVSAALLLLACRAAALDNGLGLVPQMGYSSWNDCGSTPNETWVKRTARYLIDSGLAAKGYNHVNVDEGWLLGRDAQTHEMVEDRALFPGGMKALGDWIHAQTIPGTGGATLKYGLYTCRGPTQCSRPEYRARCLHGAPNPPACKGPHPDGTCGCEGSQGYEERDGRWMVAAGADYIKEDSCSATQNHSGAFRQYATMRDVLNASGRAVFFSLCGWKPWYAPPDPSIGYGGGASLGNSFRIHGDGHDWGALSGAVNIMSSVAKFNRPGGWADPDLLIGPWCGIDHDPAFCGQDDLQARTQFSLWALFPAPLLISQNMLAWSAYALETYSNSEVIALNQQPEPRPARRLAGGDLAFPCAPGSANCTNVWGRVLEAGRRYALAFVNNGNRTAAVECGGACISGLLARAAPGARFAARDLWKKAPVGGAAVTAATGLSMQVQGGGGAALVTLTLAA